MALRAQGDSRIKSAMEEHPHWKTWALACGLAVVLFAACIVVVAHVVGAGVDAGQEQASTGAQAGTLSGAAANESVPDAAAGAQGESGAAGAVGGVVASAVANGSQDSGEGAQGGGAADAPGTTSASVTETPTQANAFMSAKLHMSEMPFSRSGIVAVLESEGYSHDDAVYAADKLGVDWNTKAAEMAAQYVDTMEFTRDDLIDQLEYEGFTREQAEAGATAVGL